MNAFRSFCQPAMNRHTGHWIGVVGDIGPGLLVATKSMLRREKCHDLGAGVGCEVIGDRNQITIHARGVGDESNPFALDRLEQRSQLRIRLR